MTDRQTAQSTGCRSGAWERVAINVGTMHYRELNELIHRKVSEGCTRFLLENVIGQRYIGAGLGEGVEIEIQGVPGQDLGVFNGGARITVYGNAQDGVGNTMNNGTLVIHGNVGDIPGHMARNGKIYIRGSAGFRAGIMMKEYGTTRPVMIVGESLGDYAGEYMAGGIMLVLGCSLEKGRSPVAYHVASGMFGGEIYVRGALSRYQLGSGSVMRRASLSDIDHVRECIEEFAGLFGCDLDHILDAPFTVITRAGGRPYGNLYVPSSKIAREFKPVHRDITPPCAYACPVGIPNPVIIRKLRENKIEEAFDLIDQYTPFRYSCCGMVCPGLCRAACTRGSIDEPVRIDEISRDYHPTGRVRLLEEKKTESVAVIGAGPAGLSTAWHLARAGYQVHVYEREKDIGGKLTHNIPEERLPRSEVEKDLNRIKSLDVEFHTGTSVNQQLFARLRSEHRAVVIAVGATRPRRLQFPGEEQAVTSFEFLRDLKEGKNPLLRTSISAGKDTAGPGTAEEADSSAILKDNAVVIIGAGNVAMDAACECWRLGAEKVTALDIQKPAAFGTELEHAVVLGTRILFPKFVERYERGTSGRGRVHLRSGETLDADLLIESVGELPELEFAGENLILPEDISEDSGFFTNIPGVFIVGDAAAAGLITHCIGMGRNAADAIHRQIQGLPPAVEERTVMDKRRVNPVYFQEKDQFFNTLDACMSCGTCLQCDICVEACPRGAVHRAGDRFTVDENLCSGCGVCASVCPRGAILMEEKAGGAHAAE